MGLGKFFKNLFRAADAKIDQAAEKIENENAVEFGKQDIEEMQKELLKCTDNIGTIKAEVIDLEDKIKDITEKIEKHESAAEELDAAGNEELAVKNCEAADRLERQKESLTEALNMQKSLIEDQQEAREELKQAILEMESELTEIKAMNNVTAVNAKLAEINTDGSSSALANFRARKDAAKKKMNKAKTIKEEAGSASSLEAQTEKALKKTAGSSRLEKLRAKKNA